jgi:hypothetical protein
LIVALSHPDRRATGVVSLDANVIGVDLSARRPQPPTYRGPKKRRSDDDGMEVGHG